MQISIVVKRAFALVPLILKIVTKFPTQEVIPQALTHAVITPILENPLLYPDDLKNYRPISSTPSVAKLIERTRLLQLKSHLEGNQIYLTT